jgi:hypothetical protein
MAGAVISVISVIRPARPDDDAASGTIRRLFGLDDGNVKWIDLQGDHPFKVSLMT